MKCVQLWKDLLQTCRCSFGILKYYVLSFGLFQSTYIPVIFKIASAEHDPCLLRWIFASISGEYCWILLSRGSFPISRFDFHPFNPKIHRKWRQIWPGDANAQSELEKCRRLCRESNPEQKFHKPALYQLSYTNCLMPEVNFELISNVGTVSGF